MAFEINELEGSLFVQVDKKTVKHPDQKGKCKIGGVEYWISGWDTISKESGKEYLKLKFSEVGKKEVENKASTKEDPSVPF